jgi:hypothetical protein
MAIVQLRNDTEGRRHFDRKRAAGKAGREAVECLKRRLSDASYRQMLAGAELLRTGPGRTHRGGSSIQRGRLTPRHGAVREGRPVQLKNLYRYAHVDR